MIDLLEQTRQTLDTYAAEGTQKLQQIHPDLKPNITHICFKFTDMDSYADSVKAASKLGTVTAETFNGKQISWCLLDNPVTTNDFALSWLELVEPKQPNPTNSATALAFKANGLDETVKLQSDDDRMTFRYTKYSVHPTFSTR